MTDRELIELAAKAAGIPSQGKTAPDESGRAFDIRWWNPLTNDGDALRLVADLRLIVKPGKHLGDGCTVEAQSGGIAGCTCFRDDKREQMRRAIVHVAAEIGKAMP